MLMAGPVNLSLECPYLPLAAAELACRYLCDLTHLHDVETCYQCPQTFLSLHFQCRDDVSDLKQML